MTKKPKEVFMPPSYICDQKKLAKTASASYLASSKASTKLPNTKNNIIDMSDVFSTDSKGIKVGSGRGVTIVSDKSSGKVSKKLLELSKPS